jgi:uncharacterized Fe-S center protein
MVDVYFFQSIEKLTSAMHLLGVEVFRGARVPVKLNMGEKGNRYYVSPAVVKLVVDTLKTAGAEPFLFDTTVAYPSARSKVDGYRRVAESHGFGEREMGCKLVIGEKGTKVTESGCSFEVAREIRDSTHMVVVSHVKGHIQSGFGGAIKNLGMGGVTREMKRKIHFWSMPRISPDRCELCGSCAKACPSEAISVEVEWRYDSASCDGCGKCVEACPHDALSYRVMDLQQGLALAAKACAKDKPALYLNVLANITRNCDCDPNPGPIICPDIGYLAAGELAAIDRASLDLVDRVKPGVFQKTLGIDPRKQVRYAEELGLPSEYQLKRP